MYTRTGYSEQEVREMANNIVNSLVAELLSNFDGIRAVVDKMQPKKPRNAGAWVEWIEEQQGYVHELLMSKLPIRNDPPEE